MTKTNKDYFDIAIKILEGSHLSTQRKYLSTQICVQVGEEKRYTKIVRNTNSPIFDEYLVFTRFTSLMELMDVLITISALHVNKGFKVRQLIGSITMDVATIWHQPDRHLKKWFALSIPSDRSMQMNAFVECDLKIETTSEYFELLQLLNIGASEMIGTKRARYKVSIYHCKGLLPPPSSRFKEQEVSLHIMYAGRSRSTSRKIIADPVVWNEQIAFVELFPPMRQAMKLEILIGKKVVATTKFNLIDFFKIFHGGFLKMFGPAYIHFYAGENLYQGSVLMSLENEILGQLREFEHVDPVSISQIEHVPEEKYGVSQSFVCLAVIFDLMITKLDCDKVDIYLSLEMGGNKSLTTESYSAVSNEKFLYLPFNKKPCVSLECLWPDNTHRLYNSNVLGTLADTLREKINYSQLLTSRGCVDEARSLLRSAFLAFKTKSANVLPLLSKGITELDAKRTSFLKKNVNLLAAVLTHSDLELDTVTELCKFFLSVLDSCSEDLQESLPLLNINLNQSKHCVGSCSIHPRHIIFSKEKEKRGRNSARINSLLLKGVDGSVVAKLDVWLWLGKIDQTDKCQELLPPGYKPYTPRGGKKLPFPTSLMYVSTHSYTALCHIHSGYIDEEETEEGECDSFVRVCYLNNCKQTIISKRTLTPTWKETLKFSTIKLYLPPDYLVENPPSFMVQLWKETNKTQKVIGYRLISSTVRLHQLTDIPEFDLKWWNVGRRCEILAACEMYKVDYEGDSEEMLSTHKHCFVIPRHIEPSSVSYRLEVVFWGIRPYFARVLKQIVQPQVTLKISTATISSDVIAKANKTFNFIHDTRIVSLKLPKNRIYTPSLIINVMSNFKLFSTISVKDLRQYEYDLPNKSQWNTLIGRQPSFRASLLGTPMHRVTMPDLIPNADVPHRRLTRLATVLELPATIRDLLGGSFATGLTRSSDDSYTAESSADIMEPDWWDRYWDYEMKVYNTALEHLDEFSGLTDVLRTFPVKPKYEHVNSEISQVKAIISLYKWPVDEQVVTMEGQDPEMGALKLSEIKDRVNLFIRVYCVKATDLYPSDLNGKSDPYIEIATPSKTVSDKTNRIVAELNPVFGNYHEITATLPADSTLAVRVMDYDLMSKNDVIGETIIDIENRFYSKHRATCGLPETYSTSGPNAWRDIETPSQILERLCNAHNLPLPQYSEKSVTIGSNIFEINKNISDKRVNQERLALSVLNRWKEMPIVGRNLVPEHVETRPLFKGSRPGLLRGKLTMWVDMFDTSLGNIPPPIDINPRKPEAFELRVNILNTRKIPLVGETTSGKQCTDIMVTGWLGDPEFLQKTDVHHKSYNGNGEFNWRFVFPFLYFRKEKKMVFYTKNLFDIGKMEHKVPAILNLEVYDGEREIDKSALIGGMTLDLHKIPRAAPSVRACKKVEKMFDHSNCVDLFKVGQMKGWWPFLLANTILKSRGFVEVEIFLMPAEEARKRPAGRGRAPPDPLPVPPRASGRKSPWQVVEELVEGQDCQKVFGITLETAIVLCLIALIGALIYMLPSTFEKLKPYLAGIYSLF